MSENVFPCFSVHYTSARPVTIRQQWPNPTSVIERSPSSTPGCWAHSVKRIWNTHFQGWRGGQCAKSNSNCQLVSANTGCRLECTEQISHLGGQRLQSAQAPQINTHRHTHTHTLRGQRWLRAQQDLFKAPDWAKTISKHPPHPVWTNAHKQALIHTQTHTQRMSFLLCFYCLLNTMKSFSFKLQLNRYNEKNHKARYTSLSGRHYTPTHSYIVVMDHTHTHTLSNV